MPTEHSGSTNGALLPHPQTNHWGIASRNTGQTGLHSLTPSQIMHTSPRGQPAAALLKKLSDYSSGGHWSLVRLPQLLLSVCHRCCLSCCMIAARLEPLAWCYRYHWVCHSNSSYTVWGAAAPLACSGKLVDAVWPAAVMGTRDHAAEPSVIIRDLWVGLVQQGGGEVGEEVVLIDLQGGPRHRADDASASCGQKHCKYMLVPIMPYKTCPAVCFAALVASKFPGAV